MMFLPNRALAVLLTSGVWLMSPVHAHAYCRALTQNPPPEFDQTKECFAGTPVGVAKPIFWSNACVGFNVQQDASRQVTLEGASRATTAAFAVWASADCGGGVHPSIDVVDMGPVACDRVEYNKAQPNQHVVVFRDDVWPYPNGYNTLGLTTLRPDEVSGEIFDADIEINSATVALQAERPVPPGSVDLQAVLTHEAGHYLGLAHSTDPKAVMYAYYQPVSGALTADDIEGICAIYPPGGRLTGSGRVPSAPCDPLPRHGFSSQCSVPGADVTENPAEPSSGGCSAGRGGANASVAVSRQWSTSAFAIALTSLAIMGRRRAGRIVTQ